MLFAYFFVALASVILIRLCRERRRAALRRRAWKTRRIWTSRPPLNA